jgi:hypothetical protein
MSLNWQVDGIKDYKDVCWREDGSMNPVTEVLIFGTISVGLGSITDKNVDEFAARFRIMEKIHGAFLYKPAEVGKADWYLSDEDFIAHIGLTCNVTNESRAQWARRIFVTKMTSVTEEYTRSFNHNRKKVTA